MDREKNTMMMAPFRHVVLRIPLSSIVLSIIRQIRREQKTSMWEKQMRGPDLPAPLENKENIKQRGV
jgi:hypothetical protein